MIDGCVLKGNDISNGELTTFLANSIDFSSYPNTLKIFL